MLKFNNKEKNIYFKNYYKHNTTYAPYESVIVFFIKKFKEIIFRKNVKNINIFEFGSGTGNNIIFIIFFILGIKKFNFFYDFKKKYINLLKFNIFFLENNKLALKKFTLLINKILKLSRQNNATFGNIAINIKYSSLPRNIDIFFDRNSLLQHTSKKITKIFIKKLYQNMNNNSSGFISVAGKNHYSIKSIHRHSFNTYSKNEILVLLKDFYIEEFHDINKSIKKNDITYNTCGYEVIFSKRS
jgi:hypothetical protein